MSSWACCIVDSSGRCKFRLFQGGWDTWRGYTTLAAHVRRMANKDQPGLRSVVVSGRAVPPRSNRLLIPEEFIAATSMSAGQIVAEEAAYRTPTDEATARASNASWFVLAIGGAPRTIGDGRWRGGGVRVRRVKGSRSRRTQRARSGTCCHTGRSRKSRWHRPRGRTARRIRPWGRSWCRRLRSRARPR